MRLAVFVKNVTALFVTLRRCAPRCFCEKRYCTVCNASSARLAVFVKTAQRDCSVCSSAGLSYLYSAVAEGLCEVSSDEDSALAESCDFLSEPKRAARA